MSTWNNILSYVSPPLSRTANTHFVLSPCYSIFNRKTTSKTCKLFCHSFSIQKGRRAVPCRVLPFCSKLALLEKWTLHKLEPDWTFLWLNADLNVQRISWSFIIKLEGCDVRSGWNILTSSSFNCCRVQLSLLVTNTFAVLSTLPDKWQLSRRNVWCFVPLKC